MPGICRLTLVICLSGAAGAAADLPEARDDGGLVWGHDYPAAYQRAAQQGRLLLIYFARQPATAAGRHFQQHSLTDPGVRRRLARYERVKLAVGEPVLLEEGPVDLLRHPSFVHMRGREGLAVVDLQHREAPYFGRAVSCLPFEPPVYYVTNYAAPRSIRTLLDLPPGSITQRSMVYAVRMHPDRPASAVGAADPRLMDECRGHSRHQARLRRQGHHRWEARFRRIWAAVGGRHPVEVCAESWPGQGLVAASLDCVHSWRQSAGHWQQVRSPQPAYGYDIQRGSNGIWYATGIFGG
ncbi:MAG: hypothetical protein GTO03_13545 [Planctomycetales bacterium]|nr:hypothetical protein [Planctomycetales bacterium]